MSLWKLFFRIIFAPMQNRLAIYQLIFANTISGIAQGISMIAIPWYFAIKEEMVLFGVIYAIATFLTLFWVPYCGILVDKYDRKKVFLTLNIISGIVIIGIALIGFSMESLHWGFVGFVFAMTFFNYSLHYPALYAFAQEIMEVKYYGRITSLLEIVQQCSAILAGAGAALLLEGSKDGLLILFGFVVQLGWNMNAWSIYEIFLIDGATYLLSFGIIYFISYHPLRKRTPEVGSIIRRIKTGLKWLKKHPNMMVFGIASYAVFAVVMVIGFYLSANYVKQHLQASGDVFATSEMFFALGAVFAGFAIQKIFKAFTLPTSVFIMTFIVAIVCGFLFSTQSVAIFYLSMFLLGMTNAGIRIQRITFLFQHIPNQVYGRTTSVFRIFNVIMRSFFLVIFTLSFFQYENVNLTFAIMTIFLIIATGVLVWNKIKLEAIQPNPKL